MLTGVDLVGIFEIRQMLRLSRQRIYQLIEKDDFPEPVATLSVGRIWLREDIERWARKRSS